MGDCLWLISDSKILLKTLLLSDSFPESFILMNFSPCQYFGSFRVLRVLDSEVNIQSLDSFGT